jgi:hypothetical protein
VLADVPAWIKAAEGIALELADVGEVLHTASLGLPYRYASSSSGSIRSAPATFSAGRRPEMDQAPDRLLVHAQSCGGFAHGQKRTGCDFHALPIG